MDSIIDKKIAYEVAGLLLKIRAVTINTDKPYRYTSGILAPMYTDNRLLISYPIVWQKVIDYYIEAIKKAVGLQKFDVLSGTATAAIPHASVLALKLSLPMVYVRSSKKAHGKENLIEGTFKKGSKVLVIEDLISTGKSSAQNVLAIRENGGKVTDCIAITTSTKNAFVETFKNLKIRLFTLTNAIITVQAALEKGYINQKQYDMVELFFEDPKGWGKKMGFE